MPARHFAFLAPALFAAALLALSGCDAVNKIVVGTKLSPRLVSSASPAAPEASPTPDANAALALPFDKTMYAPMNGRCLDNRVPVIMYHDVVKKRDKKSVWFDITLAEFSAQMEYLDAHNIMPISLDQLHRHLTRGEPIPEHCVVLTFDDNYQGFYDYAYPLLRSKRFPSAMFVHTNYVGDKTVFNDGLLIALMRLYDAPAYHAGLAREAEAAKLLPPPPRHRAELLIRFEGTMEQVLASPAANDAAPATLDLEDGVNASTIPAGTGRGVTKERASL